MHNILPKGNKVGDKGIPGISTQYKFWIAVVLLFSLGYRFFRINSVPEGYLLDEIGSAYDAWSLLHYGVDRYRISWPVYFINFGGGQNALYDYMLVVSMAVFGFNQFAVRLPAVFNSFLLAVSGLGIIGLIWDNAYGVRKETVQFLYIILYAIAPYTQMSARLGLESLAMLGWSTTFLYLFLLAIDHKKKGTRYHKLLFLFSGLVCGLTLYTYAISYLVIPLFLLLSLFYLLLSGGVCIRNKIIPANAKGEKSREESREMQISLADILFFVVPLIILAIPLILEQYINLTGSDSITLFGTFTVTRLFTYRSSEITFSNIIDNLFLTIKAALFYDWIDYNTTSKFWTFYPMSVPFFFVGFMAAMSRFADRVSNRKYDHFVLPVLWFIAQLFVCCLLGENGDEDANPNTNKINGIFFMVMLFIVIGYVWCFKNMRDVQWKKMAAGLIAACYLVLFIRFSDFYWLFGHTSGSDL